MHVKAIQGTSIRTKFSTDDTTVRYRWYRRLLRSVGVKENIEKKGVHLNDNNHVKMLGVTVFAGSDSFDCIHKASEICASEICTPVFERIFFI
jgi:hypothetical protein